MQMQHSAACVVSSVGTRPPFPSSAPSEHWGRGNTQKSRGITSVQAGSRGTTRGLHKIWVDDVKSESGKLGFCGSGETETRVRFQVHEIGMTSHPNCKYRACCHGVDERGGSIQEHVSLCLLPARTINPSSTSSTAASLPSPPSTSTTTTTSSASTLLLPPDPGFPDGPARVRHCSCNRHD